MSTSLARASTTFRALPPLPPDWLSLGHAFFHRARTHPHQPCISDSSGQSLNYHEALLKSLATANILHEVVGDSEYVGILLPPSVGAVLVNIALTLLGKTPVNLNYTCSQSVFDSCVEQCGINHIITSKKVLDRFPLHSQASFLQAEDLHKRATLKVKAQAWSEADLIPERLMGFFMPGLARDHDRNRLEEPATIIFTAGSTGDPKGVILTHRNVLSNLLGIQIHKQTTGDEVVLGVAPLFHAFGFTAALWTPLVLGYEGVYHPDPFDAQTIGKICEERKVSILFCTPTMMRAYARKCKREQFKTMTFFVAGGEKLNAQLAQEIEEKLGVIPLEGYGLTETSPVISCTIPSDIVLPDGRKLPGRKTGTVGIPVPGTEIRVVDISSFEELPASKEGMILVRGPQVMKGYLNKPEATDKVMRGEWFITGDLGYCDEEGYLIITGRLSQFSKIGGEMVPHLAVEREIARITGIGEMTMAVTSVPDRKRGERIAVLYSDLGMTPEEVVKRMRASKISKLWIPDARDFVQLDKLPVLGTGKMDLRKIKEIACEHSLHSCG